MFETWEGLGIDQACERLSPAEIGRYAAGAGFSGSALSTAVAIAMAESGGNTCAHNSTPPDDSYGLWQINMLGAKGPQRRAALGLKTNDELFDPATNADAAFYVSGGGRSFQPWTTFTHGAYAKYLNQVPSAPGSIVAQSEGDSGDPNMVPVIVPDQIQTTSFLTPVVIATGVIIAAVLLS